LDVVSFGCSSLSTGFGGRIQLNFGALHGHRLEKSLIWYQSMKRATTLEETIKNLGPASKWDWKQIESTARKIKYQIHNKNGYQGNK
jgi:hypothetical protein